MSYRVSCNDTMFWSAFSSIRLTIFRQSRIFGIQCKFCCMWNELKQMNADLQPLPIVTIEQIHKNHFSHLSMHRKLRFSEKEANMRNSNRNEKSGGKQWVIRKEKKTRRTIDTVSTLLLIIFHFHFGCYSLFA